MNGTPADPGHGPPPGPLATPGPSYNLADLAKQTQQRVGGGQLVRTDDPGFMPPHDPMGVGNAEARTKLVYRDLPLVTVQNTWDVHQARHALYAHMIGIFESSGQLVDSELGDPRVMATTRSRVTALFGRPVKFTPANDSSAAKEVCDAWEKHWPVFAGSYGLQLAHVYAIHMGWSASQVVWDVSGDLDLPHLRFWHPRFTYYQWDVRKYIAISQDGNIPIIPGDGKWLLYAPHGEYRGWVHGAIRAVTEPWLYRHFGARDMARFSELHGLPTRKGKVPAASDPTERGNFEQNLANLGSDAALIVPTGVDGVNSYDYELVEAKDTAWESFPGLIDRADMDIVLAILMVNLTTEVKGGSFAATTAHMDKERGGTEFDNQGWKHAIHNQVAAPFAWLNYGDPSLAPWTEWDIKSRDEANDAADRFGKIGAAINVLRQGGIEFTDAEKTRQWMVKVFDLQGLPEFKITEPVKASPEKVGEAGTPAKGAGGDE